MKVMWLASWYPTVLSPFNGDFIQRHARAASLYTCIDLFHVVKDAEGRMTADQKTIITVTGNLREHIIYYRPKRTGIAIVDRLLSDRKYRSIYKKALTEFTRQEGKPALVHVQVAMKAGLMARWYKKTFSVPYLVTEHWAGFYDYAKPNLDDYNALYLGWWSKIFRDALSVSFVSASLKDCVTGLFNIKDAVVIPNVVDHTLFFPVTEVKSSFTRFIHVSNMNAQKNPEDILKAFSIFKAEGKSFRLDLYGPVRENNVSLVKDLGLIDDVHFKGEAPQEIIAKAMQSADALILYSRYESFGCVLIEANACGIPVVVSELPVLHELLDGEPKKALFAPGENAAQLAEQYARFVHNRSLFNKQEIAASTTRFDFKTIGARFQEWYASQLP